jgi:MFS family permease
MLAQNFLFGVVAYSQTYYLPLFFQNARRLSPLTSAALMLPITCAQMISSIISGQYISRRERYGEVIWTGFFLWTLGVGLTCMFSLDTPIYAMVIILFIQGVGIGSVFQPVLVALQAHCTKAQRAVVISNRNFIRSLGGAVGLAISAAALQNSLHKAMPAEFASLALSSYDTPDIETLEPEQVRQILEAYAKASRTVFIMNVPFMVLCLAGCLLIKDQGLQRPGEVQGNVELSDQSDRTDVKKIEEGKSNGVTEQGILLSR